MFARMTTVFLLVAWMIAAPAHGQNEKQEAEKLVEARREELQKARAAAEDATLRAKQARKKADEATEKADRDYRNYLAASNHPAARTIAEAAFYSMHMNRADAESAASKKAAKEAVAQARQLEEDATRAVAAVAEVQSALRRAEETAAQVATNPAVAKVERNNDEKRLALMQAEINKLRAEMEKKAGTAGKKSGSPKGKQATEKPPPSTTAKDDWSAETITWLLGGAAILVMIVGIVGTVTVFAMRRKGNRRSHLI